MSITKKEISKVVFFFHYKEINSRTIDELIAFLGKNPQVSNSKYTDGTGILLSDIQINLNNNKPTSLSIGINKSGQVIYKEVLPETYYFFSGSEISSVKNIDNLHFHIT